MANKGTMSISSATLNEINKILDTGSNIITSDITSKMSDNFSALSSIGYGDALSKIKEQIDDMLELTAKLMRELSSHLVSTQDTEANLQNALQNKQLPTNVTNSNSYGGGTHYTAPVTNEDKDKGKEIISDILKDIKNRDDKSIVNLIELINQNKGKLSLTELIFGYKTSEELVKALSKALGLKISDKETFTKEDEENVKKTLIEKLFDVEPVPLRLIGSSILTAKEYIKEIAEQEKMSIGDLLVDEKNKELLVTSLSNLYNGTNLDGLTISNATVSSFRIYVDSVASDKNMTATDVLKDVTLML